MENETVVSLGGGGEAQGPPGSDKLIILQFSILVFYFTHALMGYWIFKGKFLGKQVHIFKVKINELKIHAIFIGIILVSKIAKW